MRIKSKNGIALNQAFGAVLTLVLVAILVIIGIFLFVNLGATFVNLDPQTITAEASTAVNETGSVTTNSSLCNFGSYVVVTANNASQAGVVITQAGNYTVNSATGVITYNNAVNADGLNNTIWSLNATYNWGGASCEATDEMIVQFGTYPVLIGLVGTIIFLGLVIGVLVASFVFGRRDGV